MHRYALIAHSSMRVYIKAHPYIYMFSCVCTFTVACVHMAYIYAHVYFVLRLHIQTHRYVCTYYNVHFTYAHLHVCSCFQYAGTYMHNPYTHMHALIHLHTRTRTVTYKYSQINSLQL